MEIGQFVEWGETYGNPDRYPPKIGRVILTVPAGRLPTETWLSQKIDLRKYRKWYLNTSIPRKEVSYIVANRLGGLKSKPRLLWPRVKELEKIPPRPDLKL